MDVPCKWGLFVITYRCPCSGTFFVDWTLPPRLLAEVGPIQFRFICRSTSTKDTVRRLLANVGPIELAFHVGLLTCRRSE